MVARPQSGVCAESSLHGLVLLCQLRNSHFASARLKLARIPSLVKSLDSRFSEALLTVVTAVSARGWERLGCAQKPPGLSAFPRFNNTIHSVTAHPFDLAFVIRSDRADANFFAGRVLMEWFGDDLELAAEHNLFHYLDNRSLLGFRCVPGAVHGRKREQLSLLDEPDEPLWHRGAHLFIQHYLLDVERWQSLSVEQQEQIVGRRKMGGERITTPLPSHADKTEQAAQPRVLWQQMPSASMREQGHLDLLWSQSAEALTDFLRQRMEEDEEGFSDPLLDYQSNAMSGAFFAPPEYWFHSLTAEYKTQVDQQRR
ncbi:MAG: Dyp-type peroxidase [Idiomarina sp.]|nr:Dyp-type peroxidase [Idiomarina sp.]